jgi:hypothetical protein
MPSNASTVAMSDNAFGRGHCITPRPAPASRQGVDLNGPAQTYTEDKYDEEMVRMEIGFKAYLRI